jgi:hypothetical protein
MLPDGAFELDLTYSAEVPAHTDNWDGVDEEEGAIESPRAGLVARVTTWLLDSVLGPVQPFIPRALHFQESVRDVAWLQESIREAGWLQPLVGSRVEGHVLDFMCRFRDVLNIAKQRRKKAWRQNLLEAAVEVQWMCETGVKTLCRTDIATSALHNRWIQKVINSRLVPQQLRHWGSVVLSPGTLETIHENVPMPADQLQLGSEHFQAPAGDIGESHDTADADTSGDETACTESDFRDIQSTDFSDDKHVFSDDSVDSPASVEAASRSGDTNGLKRSSRSVSLLDLSTSGQ